MKKGLLLSIIASTVLFAGGDIAPYEPVAEAPAASCNDFYGAVTVGAFATYVADNNKTAVNDSNLTVDYGVGAVLGVSREIFSGLMLNAEVQGSAVETYTKIGDGNGTRGPGFVERGGLTQLNVAYSFGNTAIKVGRFTIEGPTKELSLLVNTGKDDFGLKKTSYEGVIIANTDLADTTLWAGYIYNQIDFTKDGDIGGTRERSRLGVAAVGFQNKSLADTTITAVGYYDFNGTANQPWTWMAAGIVDHSFGDTGVSLGGAFTQWDKKDSNGSYVVGGLISQKVEMFGGMFDAKLAASFANDGKAKLGKFTDITNPVGGTNAWGVGAKLGTMFEGFKTTLGVSYSANKDNKCKKGVGSITLAKKYRGIDFEVGYKITKEKGMNYKHNVHVQAVYKF